MNKEELKINDLRIVKALMDGNHLEQYEILRATHILNSLALNLHNRSLSRKVE